MIHRTISRAMQLTCLALVAFISHAWAAPVALVTDIQGTASIEGSQTARALEILTELEDGARVRVEAATRVVVLNHASRQEWVIQGPATVRIDVAGVTAISGTTPVHGAVLSTADRPGVPTKDGRVAQAGTVMRGATFADWVVVQPAGARVLETRPEFRWTSLAGATAYKFSLADAGGRVILESPAGESGFKLPAEIELARGLYYTWRVTAQVPGRPAVVRAGALAVADQATQDEVTLTRPNTADSISRWIAFGWWLEQQELKDEARKVWQHALAQRPEDARLRRLVDK